MKRRYRSKLQKLENETCIDRYQPTLEDCKKWFRILNREIFSQILPECPFDIRTRRGAWGYYFYEYEVDRPDYIYAEVRMNTFYKSKKHFVEVLGHEMVHHYQVLHGQPLGHGPTFHQWRSKFNKKGLRLLETGYEHEK